MLLWVLIDVVLCLLYVVCVKISKYFYLANCEPEIVNGLISILKWSLCTLKISFCLLNIHIFIYIHLSHHCYYHHHIGTLKQCKQLGPSWHGMWQRRHITNGIALSAVTMLYFVSQIVLTCTCRIQSDASESQLQSLHSAVLHCSCRFLLYHYFSL